jgi:fucose 4-O-acetylase-like acetyltransferase
MNRERLLDVDRAKGLAISLVVIGHLFINEVPAGNEWYFRLNAVIYKFHMPFFMFLTGLVTFYTLPDLGTFADCANFVKKKLLRFVPAYLLFALVVWASKFAAARFLYVERPVSGLSDFITVLIRPRYSYCGSLWYIYVVSIYFLALPLLLKLFRQKLELLLTFAFALHFVPSTSYFALEQVFEYMFVFILGGYVARYLEPYYRLLDGYFWAFLPAFAGVLIFAFQMEMPKLIVGLISLPALHSLVRWGVFKESSLLRLLGKYTFPIYLMNTLAIGLPRALIQKYGFWDNMNFLLMCLVLLLSGIFVPIAAQRYFISKTPVLRKIVY